MMLLPMLLLAQDADSLLLAAHERTTAEHRCVRDTDSTDITVCGMRNADRFRAPFASHAVARIDNRPAATAALLHERTPYEERGPFLVGGGMAGVHAGVALGPGEGSGRASAGGLRPLAP